MSWSAGGFGRGAACGAAVLAASGVTAAQEARRDEMPLARVLKVVGEDGAPVAGARVVAPSTRSEPLEGPDALEAKLAAFEVLGVSDRRGHVRLTDERACLAVLAPPAFAHVHLDRADLLPPIAVLLRPRTLRARAIDDEGRPVANVPLAIHHHETEEHWFGDWIVRTGSDGCADWSLAELVLPQERPYPAEDPIVVAPAFPTRTWPAIRLTRELFAAQRVDVPIGGVGRLELEVRDERGEIEAIESPLPIWFLGDQLVEEESREFDRRSGEPWRVELVNGRAIFDPIGIGLRVKCYDRDDSGAGWYEAAFDGPTKVGATAAGVVRHRVGPPLREGECGLRGRAVDARGPIVHRTLVAWRFSEVRGTSRWQWNEDDELGADGRFSLPSISTYPEPAPPTLVIGISSEEHGLVKVGRIALTVENEYEGGELGDVLLQDAPLLVTGTVTGSDGAPVADAKVWLKKAGRPLFQRTPNMTMPIELAIGRTDEHGRFSIHGIADCRKVELVLRKPGFAGPFRRILEPGATDLEIRLERAARIVGRFAVVPPSPLEVIAFQETVPFDWQERLRAVTDESGRFEIDEVPAGTFALFVESHPYTGGCVVPQTLLQVEGIEVRTGEIADVGILELGCEQASRER